jgi:4-diphosphocytidyl-2-C-methyl-D-erythritol kinase
MKNVRVRTPAKVNIFLRVLARRADGYHNIETLFQAIGIEDELVIEKSSRETRLESPGFPELENEKNLVLRALRWLETETGSALPVRIRLYKRIPLAAGLGGGSSDAAAALVGLSSLFELNLPGEALARGAKSLGADVPFFLMGGTAIGEGIGDLLTRVDLPFDCGIMLINPDFPVSTPAVYREYSRSLTGAAREGKLWHMVRGLRNPKDILYNDLQSAAKRLYPQLSEIEESLKRAGLEKPLMSGSGPTFFELGKSERLQEMRERLPKGFKTFVTLPVFSGPVID